MRINLGWIQFSVSKTEIIIIVGNVLWWWGFSLCRQFAIVVPAEKRAVFTLWDKKVILVVLVVNLILHFTVFQQTWKVNLWSQAEAATIPFNREKKMSCLQRLSTCGTLEDLFSWDSNYRRWTNRTFTQKLFQQSLESWMEWWSCYERPLNENVRFWHSCSVTDHQSVMKWNVAIHLFTKCL